MKTKLVLALIIAVVLTTFPTSALAWGPATHAYLAKELGDKFGVMNLQEMYGSLLPDMFNLMFGYEHEDYLWEETHYEFMKLVNIATFGRRKALGYGFASHNEAWGADYTAHVSAGTNSGEGYVVTKKNVLASLLASKIEEFFDDNDIDYTAELILELALSFADNSVEIAVDYLVSQNEDKHIGGRILLAAKYRSPFVPFLLSRAYAQDFALEAGITVIQAATMIFIIENEFKEYMEFYGWALTQANAIDLLAEQGAQLAELKLANDYGITVTVESQLMRESLEAAILIVQPDYASELTKTLDYVEDQLEVHGIETCSW